MRQQQRSYKSQIQRLGATLGPLGMPKNLRKALQEAIELRTSLLTQRNANLEKEKESVDAKLATFKTEEHPSSNPKINALGSLMENVVITLGETTEEINYEHTGPISVIENTTSGGLRYRDHSPLQVMAEEIRVDESYRGGTSEGVVNGATRTEYSHP